MKNTANIKGGQALVLLLVSMLAVNNTYGQGGGLFVVWGGGNPDEVRRLMVDASGAYVIAFSRSFGPNAVGDYYIAKVDWSGAVLWERNIGTTRADEPHGVVLTGSSILITGETNAPSPGLGENLYLVRLSLTGGVLASAKIGNSSFQNVWHIYARQWHSDRYLVWGDVLARQSWGTNDWDGFLLIIDTNLNTSTAKIARVGWLPYSDGIHDVVYTTNRDTLIAVSWVYRSGLGNADIALTILDSNFTVLNSYIYYASGSDRSEVPWRVFRVSDGYIIVGHSNSFSGFTGTYDALAMKVDHTGNVVWARWYGTNAHELVSSAELSATGNTLAIIGTTHSSAGFGSTDIFVFAIDITNGNLLWSRVYGGAQADKGADIKPDPTGTYQFIGAGTSQSFTAGSENLVLFSVTGAPTGECFSQELAITVGKATLSRLQLPPSVVQRTIARHNEGMLNIATSTNNYSCSLFPLESITLRARTTENLEVELHWQYEGTMRMGDFFAVEHLSVAGRWEELAVVPYQPQQTSYTFLHQLPHRGTNYYRLRIYQSGHTFYSHIASADVGVSSTAFSIVAFESEEKILLHMEGLHENETVVVIVQDNLGRQLFSKVIVVDQSENTLIAIDPENKLPPGTYTILGISDNSYTSTRLVVR